MAKYVLALDQGTTSSRAIVFGHDGRIVAAAQEEFPQILPGPGPGRARSRGHLVLAARGRPPGAGAGVARGRATSPPSASPTSARRRSSGTAHTGRPVANAIVWQSRASAGICDRLKAEGLEETFRAKTGLVLDAYFSGTKIKHLLDTHDGLRDRGRAGRDPLRHRRHLAHLAPDRRRAARDRLQQRQPHAALQHPHARSGTTSCWRCSTSPGRCCPRSALRARSTARRPTSGSAGRCPSRATRATSRRPPSARPASQPGSGQEHLRHRLLHAAEHGHGAGPLAEQPAHHDRLGARRRR